MTAINSIKLFLLLILGVCYFLGLGWLLIGPLLNGSLVNRKKSESSLIEFALALISGLIINYGLVLIFQSLKTSLLVGGSLAVIGVSLYLLMWVKSIKINPLSANAILKVFGIILVSGLFLGPILFIPLMEWDSRSIWFFHAKMIFSSGTLSQATGWQNPAVIDFSHADYPNLLPTLAAQITYLVGYWNEYLPKLCLFFFIIPAVSILFSFSRRSFSFLFLIILLIFSYSPKLWDGHMDGFLALFFAISMLLLGRYFQSSKSIDLLSSFFCLIVLLYLKNEGDLAALSGIFSVFLVLILKKTHFSISKLLRNHWKLMLLIFLLLIPFGLWNYYKHLWGLSNDLGLGSTQSFQQLLMRINDGSYKIIFERIIGQLENCLMLFGFLLIASFVFIKKVHGEIVPALFAAGIYCLGMFAIYMVTPLNLVTHLNDSVFRTMLTVIAAVYVACYYLVEALENNEVKQSGLMENVKPFHK